MERLRTLSPAKRTLPLIVLLQAQLSSAFPFHPEPPRYGKVYDDVLTITSTSCKDSWLPARTVTISERPAGQAQPELPHNAQTSNVVYQIPDGQIQAPYYAPSVQVPITTSSSSSTSTSTSVLSARDVTTPSAWIPPPSPYNNAAVSSFTTSVPDSSLTSLTTSEVQSASSSELAPTSTSGSVVSSLVTSVQVSSQPFATSIADDTSSLSFADTSTAGSVQPTKTVAVSTLSASGIFRPIATGGPPEQIEQIEEHPKARKGIEPQDRKLQTNKFYSALYLDNQTSPVYTFPYSVSWAGGNGELKSWGLAISHVEPREWATAPGAAYKDAGQWAFFGAPVGIQSIVLSAVQLSVDNNTGYTPGLTTDSLEWGSVKANLYPPGWQTPVISFPLVQGSPFITGEYHWAQPFIQSSIGFQNLTFVGAVNDTQTYKYRAFLRNDIKWLIYVTPDDPTYSVNKFDLDPAGAGINGHSGFNGYIQVAKVPRQGSSDNMNTNYEDIYDRFAGTYPTGVNITGSVDDTKGSYTLSWNKKGTRPLLMFALPHHVSSMDTNTQTGFTELRMRTTTKGMATAVSGDSWTMFEDSLPIDMGFAPWTPNRGSVKTLSQAAIDVLNVSSHAEIAQNVAAQADVGSAYYDGKALAKFAALVYTTHQIVGNETLALTGLFRLQEAFEMHVNQEQKFPFVYEKAWGGLVSMGAYVTGNALQDFGNTYYNDHHFHYGYFVYAAAVIGYLNPTWLNNGTNKEWVNLLVRDFANSDPNDKYFPFSRAFDWYHGHSWAAGLFDSADGKNQESSSEDTMASYAIKMWGQVINDKAMEARGNLMLAIQRRSLQDYYLYENDNEIEPKEFIGNKAAGILFENKIDHTTYFGANPEYIQGIHMIPIMPFSTYIRTPQLVTQEWAAYFSNLTNSTVDGPPDVSYVSRVQGGWRGILMANYAICNNSAARESYDFFSNDTFDAGFLDGGASQTWYLAWAAALAGGPIYD